MLLAYVCENLRKHVLNIIQLNRIIFFNILLTSTHRKYKARQSSHISFNCSYLTSFSSIFYFPKVQIGISGSQAFALKLSGEFYLDNSPSLLGGTKMYRRASQQNRLAKLFGYQMFQFRAK